MKITRLLPVLLKMLLLLALPVEASLLVRGELTHEYQVSGGQVLSGVLEISNAGSTPKRVSISQQSPGPDGSQQAHPRSNQSWVRLSDNQLHLPAGATRQLAYTVAVPAGVQPGTYWSVINIEPETGDPVGRYQQPGKVTIGLRQRLRYSINIMTHAGRGNAQLSFHTPQIGYDQYGHKALELHLQNSGAFHGRPEVSMELFDLQGNSLGSLKGNKRGLYPHARKHFAIPLRNTPPGQYKALLVATDTRSGRVFGADMNLTIHP